MNPFKLALKIIGQSGPLTRQSVQFFPRHKIWTALQSGSAAFRFEPQFQTEHYHPESMGIITGSSALYLHEISIILRRYFSKLVMFPFGVEIHKINGIQTREAVCIIVAGIIYFNFSNSLHNQ